MSLHELESYAATSHRWQMMALVTSLSRCCYLVPRVRYLLTLRSMVYGIFFQYMVVA